MQQQMIDLINKLQIFLPLIREHISIITAIILVFIIWALKYQLLRQNRRFLQQLKQEWHAQTSPHPTTESPIPKQLNAYLLEQKILVYQTLLNLKSEYDADQQNASESTFSTKKYYQYFKELHEIVIHNRFYLTQETEYVFNQLMQDHCTILYQLKQIESQFSELPNPTTATETDYTELMAQEQTLLDNFFQYSRAQMSCFWDKIAEDALKLRAELDT